VSPLRGTYLFTNRQGQKALSMTADQLAERFRSDRARLVEAEPLVDQAFTSMMASFGDTAEAKTAQAKTAETKTADPQPAGPQTDEPQFAELQIEALQIADPPIAELQLVYPPIAEGRTADARSTESTPAKSKPQ
jgi:hypothetical protein